MKYEVYLLHKDTKEVITTYNGIFEPMVGDIIKLSPESCFVVNKRILPNSDSNRIVCLGIKDLF